MYDQSNSKLANTSRIHIGDYYYDTNNYIGKGSTAHVYCGLRIGSGNNKYAIKILKTFDNPMIQRALEPQFHKEIELLKKLKHRNIVRLIDHTPLDELDEKKNSIRYLVLEYCQGGDVASILQKPENHCGFSQPEYFSFQKQVTDGLGYLYEQKVMHRDIKPENIMANILGDGSIEYKISDLGAARQINETDEQYGYQTLCGTPQYLELTTLSRYNARNSGIVQTGQLPGTNPYKADLWSLGVTLYHVATGQQPFNVTRNANDDEERERQLRERPDDCISGTLNLDTNEVGWSKELPTMCHLSPYVRGELADIIRFALSDERPTSETFSLFCQQADIMFRTAYVPVFNAESGTVLTICLDAQTRPLIAKLKEKIAIKTEIKAEQQILFIGNTRVSDDQTLPEGTAIQIVKKQITGCEPTSVFLFDKAPRNTICDAASTHISLRDFAQERVGTNMVKQTKKRLGKCLYVKKMIQDDHFMSKESIKSSMLLKKEVIRKIKEQSNTVSQLQQKFDSTIKKHKQTDEQAKQLVEQTMELLRGLNDTEKSDCSEHIQRSLEKKIDKIAAKLDEVKQGIQRMNQTRINDQQCQHDLLIEVGQEVLHKFDSLVHNDHDADACSSKIEKIIENMNMDINKFVPVLSKDDLTSDFSKKVEKQLNDRSKDALNQFASQYDHCTDSHSNIFHGCKKANTLIKDKLIFLENNAVHLTQLATFYDDLKNKNDHLINQLDTLTNTLSVQINEFIESNTKQKISDLKKSIDDEIDKLKKLKDANDEKNQTSKTEEEYITKLEIMKRDAFQKIDPVAKEILEPNAYYANSVSTRPHSKTRSELRSVGDQPEQSRLSLAQNFVLLRGAAKSVHIQSSTHADATVRHAKTNLTSDMTSQPLLQPAQKDFMR